MKTWRFLLICCCFFLIFLLMGIMFNCEVQAERDYNSQHLRISVVFWGGYDSGTGSGGFEALYSEEKTIEEKISIFFIWKQLKVYEGKKRIDSDIDSFLRKSLTKSRKIDVMGSWADVITTSGLEVFMADRIYFPVEIP